MNTMRCPCQSGKSYATCCEPLHLHTQPAETAEQLMRSRYCAYVLHQIDYIVATTVPNQQPLLDRNAMQNWAQNTQWLGLEIVRHQVLSKQHSRVEFNAFFQTENKQAHHEISLFVRLNERWFFVDPTVPLPTMKQPCVCGSGKKFKLCCGRLLTDTE